MRYWLSIAGIVCVLCSPLAFGGSVVLDDVPAYLWYGGCGPTAGGMVLGYWENHGYRNMITAGDGSANWATNADGIRQTIASPEYFRDYYNAQPDLPSPHADNCLADFMGASRGSLVAGGVYDTKVASGLVNFAKGQGYAAASGSKSSYSPILWDKITGEINAGRPVVLLVDSTGDHVGDHFITAIGYDNTASLRFAAYDTYDLTLHWYNYGSTAMASYGVESAMWFNPGPLPGDCNGDGVVNFSDYLVLEASFGQSGKGIKGDCNADGVVDFGDYLTLEANFGGSTPAPEPCTATLLLAGAGVLLRRRSGGHRGH